MLLTQLIPAVVPGPLTAEGAAELLSRERPYVPLQPALRSWLPSLAFLKHIAAESQRRSAYCGR